jgi:hypothetical protein
MKYFVEVIKNRKSLVFDSFNASHPNQVIRKVVLSVKYTDFFMLIMSSIGIVWIYYVDEFKRVRFVSKKEIYGLELDYIKSGNKTISKIIDF